MELPAACDVKAVAERDVLAAAQTANPRCSVTLKFRTGTITIRPWVDIEAEANLFPNTFVGTETRTSPRRAALVGSKHSSYSELTNLRWHARCAAMAGLLSLMVRRPLH